jgi:hypothetical protein
MKVENLFEGGLEIQERTVEDPQDLKDLKYIAAGSNGWRFVLENSDRASPESFLFHLFVHNKERENGMSRYEVVNALRRAIKNKKFSVQATRWLLKNYEELS